MSKFSVRRLALDAVLIALYYALSMLAVEIGGVKITFVALTTILAAVLYGPVDAFLIGLLGAFLEQMMKYAFTATTVLWILPEAIRGLLFGLCVVLFAGKFTYERLLSPRTPFFYYGACVATGLLTSVLNTLVYYVDAQYYGYYHYALIFGVFWYRLLLSVGVSLVLATLVLAIYSALKKTSFWKRGA